MQKTKQNLSHLVTVITALLVCGLLSTISNAQSSAEGFSAERDVIVDSPGTDLWRAVRGRTDVVGKTQVKGPDTATMITTKGQEWRELRTQKIIPYAMILLGAVLLLLLLYRLIFGKAKIKSGRSANKIARFTSVQRFVHWVVAILFVILGITGLILTFGRDGLIPLIGNEAFGSLAYVAKIIHDYIGPVFALALLLMLFTFIKGNFPKGVDFKWLLKLGGLFGGHPDAGRYNAGEKLWFWLAILGGAVVVGSGLVLDFPIFGQGRELMQQSTVIHVIGAVVILAASFGHIYLGTVGMEGAFESMKTGYCDENWAKEHHNLWFDEMNGKGLVGKTHEEIKALKKST
ncbi:MAG: formate dehydrogenase subunit gamma [Parvicella sp.]|jgi:formate dehydrogenase subunit gamma